MLRFSTVMPPEPSNHYKPQAWDGPWIFAAFLQLFCRQSSGTPCLYLV
jgi:hypothetical protein